MGRGSAAAVADLGPWISERVQPLDVAGRGSRRISADLGPWFAGLVGLRSHAGGGPLRN